MKQSLDALKYAHFQEHISHLDIKPGNILIDSKGDFKLFDF